MICERCEEVNEIYISKRIIEELEEQVSDSGYQLTNSQLELQCLFEECVNKANSAESLVVSITDTKLGNVA